MEHQDRPDGACVFVGGMYYPLDLDKFPLAEQVEVHKLIPLDEFAAELDEINDAKTDADRAKIKPDPRLTLALLWLAIHRVDTRATIDSVGELDSDDFEFLPEVEKADEPDPPELKDEAPSMPSSETSDPQEADWVNHLVGTGGPGAQ